MKRAMNLKTLLLAMLLVAIPLTLLADTVYCRYCGSKSSSISSLTASKCSRHPDGAYKGCHVPVDKGTPTGNGSKVYCEYCGASSSSISSLTASKCSRHPKGAYKGHTRYIQALRRQNISVSIAAIPRPPFLRLHHQSVRAIQMGRTRGIMLPINIVYPADGLSQSAGYAMDLLHWGCLPV